jgi:acyl dehydratase
LVLVAGSIGEECTAFVRTAQPIGLISAWEWAKQFIQRNKIRFPAPVPVDSRVRSKAEVVSIDEKSGGWWEVTRFTLEVEGNEKPCFVGDSVTRVMAPAG